MEKKNQNSRFQELVKKMEALKENEKGQLKGGFTSLNSEIASEPISTTDYNAAAYCTCSGSGSNVNRAQHCICS